MSRKSISRKGEIHAFKDGNLKYILNGRYDMAQLGFNSSNVYACANGKAKTHKGYTFKRMRVLDTEPPKDNPNEVWKDVVGYEGRYMVSSMGRVWSYYLGGLASLQKDKHNYIRVILWGNEARYKLSRVHRMVAIAFIENPYGKKCINHINGIKDDNRRENLEWATNSENIKHAYATGLMKSGEDSTFYKGEIHAFNENGELVFVMKGKLDIQKYGFDNGKVYACANGKAKTHKGYTFKRIEKNTTV